jgi:crotonobetainyl-CoA:carnitine CoA-transferase CaiB-like acyl-CoA transferase
VTTGAGEGLSALAGLRVVELGVWVAARSPAEVVTDPQRAADDGFVEIAATGSGRPLRSVNGPVSFGGVTRGATAPVPGLGEHTDEVLAPPSE